MARCRPVQVRRLDRATVKDLSCASPARRPLVSVAAPPAARSFGIVSTYPPTACGLATISAALADGLSANGAEVSVAGGRRTVPLRHRRRHGAAARAPQRPERPERLTSQTTSTREIHMPDKSPQKAAGKKAGRSLKEKREAKRAKKEGRPALER